MPGPEMSRRTLFFLIAGLALATGLIAWQGMATVAGLMATAGWRLLWLAPYYGLAIVLATASWLALFPAGAKPLPMTALGASWIGFSVNWLLPAAQIGGELVKARLVTGAAVPGAGAFASVVADKTVQALTLVLYALIGLVLLLATVGGVGVAVAAGLFVLLLGPAVWGFYRVQKAGPFAALARLARRLPIGAALAADAAATDAALAAVYARPRAVIAAGLWRLGFRLLLAGETWLALAFLGHPVSLVEAMILESLGQAVRGAAFAVPGGLGLQEGGFMALGAALGLGPETALALSLAKRVRELVIGLPGLAAWQLVEGRAAFAGRGGR